LKGNNTPLMRKEEGKKRGCGKCAECGGKRKRGGKKEGEVMSELLSEGGECNCPFRYQEGGGGKGDHVESMRV